MKVVLLNQNPVISRLVKLSLDKIGYELEEIENLTQIAPWSCDLLICDHEMVDESIDYTPFGKEILFLIPRNYEKKLGKYSLEKPFLPTDFIDKVQKISPLNEEKEDAQTTPAATKSLDSFSDSLDEGLSIGDSFDDLGVDLDDMLDKIDQKDETQEEVILDETAADEFSVDEVSDEVANEIPADEAADEVSDEVADEIPAAASNENSQSVDFEGELREVLDDEPGELGEIAAEKEVQLAELSSIVEEIDNLDAQPENSADDILENSAENLEISENSADEILENSADLMNETQDLDASIEELVEVKSPSDELENSADDILENSVENSIDEADIIEEEKEEIFDHKPGEDLADLDSISGFVPPKDEARTDDEIPENFADLESIEEVKEDKLAKLKAEIQAAEQKTAKALAEQATDDEKIADTELSSADMAEITQNMTDLMIDAKPDESTQSSDLEDELEQLEEISEDIEEQSDELAEISEIPSEADIDEAKNEADQSELESLEIEEESIKDSNELESLELSEQESLEELQEENLGTENSNLKDETSNLDDEFSGLNESDLADALGLELSKNTAQNDENSGDDLDAMKAKISEEITETLGAALANSKLKEAIKGMKIKINISFDE